MLLVSMIILCFLLHLYTTHTHWIFQFLSTSCQTQEKAGRNGQNLWTVTQGGRILHQTIHKLNLIDLLNNNTLIKTTFCTIIAYYAPRGLPPWLCGGVVYILDITTHHQHTKRRELP